MSECIAKINNLVLRRGDNILQQDISLEWKVGQHWCITGPSGSGKTTFLNILAGISYSHVGEIRYPFLEKLRLGSKEIKKISDFIAFVPQEVKISAGFFIQDLYYQRRYQSGEQENIPTTGEVLQLAKSDESLDFEEIADLMNLTKLLDQPFVQLSNGQTRRLMIALALMRKPKILVLDNPYSGLDQGARNSLNRYLKNLIDYGVHVFIAAHEHELHSLDFITDVLRLEPVLNMTNSSSLPDFYRSVVFPGKEPVIVAENVRVAYANRTILELLHWAVNPLDKWVIQGDNGSGKSTLLALIIADHPQVYANDIRIFGRKRGSGETIWDVKRRMGYFSSELLRYYSKLPTAEEVISSGWNDIAGQVKKMSEEQHEYVKSLADWLGIAALLPIRIGDLSFGQQKMVLIARAMIRNPEILILDEPLQGMDAEWREHFKFKISEFSQNRTILYVTHDVEDIPEGEWKSLKL